MFLQNLIKIQEVDSTNNYARGLIQSKTAVEGTAVLAYSQNSGRGQGKSSWESEPGKNLTASFILQPQFLKPDKQFYISMVSALSAFDFLGKYLTEVKIKWPNDLYWKNRKAGGILIENFFLGNLFEFSIAGFGININQDHFFSNAPNPVSVKQITGFEYNLGESFKVLSDSLQKWYSELERGHFALIRDAYLANLFRKDIRGRYRVKGEIIDGKITGVEETGRLIIKEETGRVHFFEMKEVEFIF